MELQNREERALDVNTLGDDLRKFKFITLRVYLAILYLKYRDCHPLIQT